jgi:class 3 adenylate cyclase
MVMYFGAPAELPGAAALAAQAALDIRGILSAFQPPLVRGTPAAALGRMGVAVGRAFAAEIGEPRGRREYNILGDAVNTAAHLMNRAAAGQILVTAEAQQQLGAGFTSEPLRLAGLKGKTMPLAVYELRGR